MKIVLFGLGKHYQNNKHYFEKLAVEIVIATDNNSSLWGQEIDGVEIMPPEDAIKKAFDYIVITNLKYEQEIHKQLREYNVVEEKIIACSDFIRIMNKGNMEVCFPLNKICGKKGKLLFMTPEIGYHGGTMAILYAATASIQSGYSPTILCSYATPKLLEEYRKKGIEFWIYPNLLYATKEELWWVPDTFTKIIANTLVMGNCVVYLKEKAPLIWWIHETLDAYEVFAENWKECNAESLKKVSLYAVTERAKTNFHKFFPEVPVDILLLGIPEEQKLDIRFHKSTDKMIFAVVGGIGSRKGQDILLEAIDKIPENVDTEFWIIGGIVEKEFATNLVERAENKKNVKILGIKNREEMRELYKLIDVVIVCSREETLSIVAIEGMINKKVCIISDTCGVSDYLEDSVDSFIFPSEDSSKLAELIFSCSRHKIDMEEIGDNARNTYEKIFSMESFIDRLQKII